MKNRIKKHSPSASRKAEASAEAATNDQASATSVAQPGYTPRMMAAFGTMLVLVFGWSYWPTIVETVTTWDREPDYSHGFFVIPIAVYFLWARRENFPRETIRPALPGVALILVSIVIRIVAAKYFIHSLDGWSIPIWTAGVVWLVAGPSVLRWSMPSILFLWFMVPLPYRVERSLSEPLQRIATKLSTWTLQSLGQPALAEGNVILLGEQQLEVAQACAGVRIFIGIIALAFAYVLFFKRPWWNKVLVLASILPITLAANSIRIVTTGLLHHYISGEVANRFTHDIAGWFMVPLAAFFFYLVVGYFNRLIHQVEVADVRDMVRPTAE